MSSATTHRTLTVDDWAELPEDVRGELEAGSLIEEEMPTLVHEILVAWLSEVLRVWGKTRRARVVGSGLKFGLDQSTGRMPDLSVFLPAAKRPPASGVVRTPPSIAIEVVSPGAADARRDRVDKLRDYARFGVRWYWLVDPGLRSFEILELDTERRYVHMVSATAGVVSEIPGCDGLTLDLDSLWRELDEVIAESGAQE